MSKKLLERRRTDNEDLEAIQDNVERALEKATGRTIVRNVAFPGGGGSVTVNHTLGRAPTGWWPVRVTGGFFQAWETNRNNRQITFTSNNACTVDLEVE